MRRLTHSVHGRLPNLCQHDATAAHVRFFHHVAETAAVQEGRVLRALHVQAGVHHQYHLEPILLEQFDRPQGAAVEARDQVLQRFQLHAEGI